MQTIIEPRKNVMLLWRPPRPAQTRYRLMKYLLESETEDGLLLYNVVTSEMVLLDQSEIEMVKRLPLEYAPEMNQLIAEHFLVKEDYDESKLVLELRAVLRKLDVPQRVGSFTILPTTECNARCYYCFESDYPRCTMTDQIAEDTVAYIAKLCKGDLVDINWFGGEPLVGKKQIDMICAGLREREIQYRSSIVTNAYLFDESVIRTAKEDWHLSTAQITLDGTETIYNEVKAYINPGENPYQRVLRNIGLLLDQKISVNVRLNVTTKNAADLSNLVDELADRFGGNKGFSAYSHAVYEGVGFDPISYNDDTREWIDIQTSALDEKLLEKKLLGSLARLPRLSTIHCMSDGDYARMIYPDGTIGKCEDKSALEGIGDIYQDIADEAMAARYKATEQIPGCGECPLFPNCVNLVVCPETGKCTKVKTEWKLDRYTALMKDKYQKYLQDPSAGQTENAEKTECES